MQRIEKFDFVNVLLKHVPSNDQMYMFVGR